MSSSLGFSYVNSANPCPLCGGVSDCRRNLSGGVHCRRTSENAPPVGWHFSKHDSHGFGLFWPDDGDDRREGGGGGAGNGSGSGDSARRRDPLADKIRRKQLAEAAAAEIGSPIALPPFARISRDRRAMSAGERERLSLSLGLPGDIFDLLPVQYVEMDDGRPAHVIPEVNGVGAVTGWGLRFLDGAKLTYGPRGIIAPMGWECWDRGGPVFIPEGMSDTLALSAMGLNALGRPSNMYGADLLAEILRGKGLQADATRAIIVLGENDRKADGSWPGRDGAEFTAKRLSDLLGRPVWIGYPPAIAKDVREYLRVFRNSAELPEIGRNFREDVENTATVVGAYADLIDLAPSPPKHVPVPVEIVFNPSGLTQPGVVDKFARVVTGRDEIVPTTPVTEEAIQGGCPNATPVLMRNDNKRLTRCSYFDCRRIECVYCGAIKRRMFARTVRVRLSEWETEQRVNGNDEPMLWLFCVPEHEWAATYRYLRRHKSDYIRIMIDFETLMVVATVRPKMVSASAAMNVKEVTVSEATAKLTGAAGRCAGKESRRPFVASKAWKLITGDKKVPPQGWRRLEKLTTSRERALQVMATHRVEYVPVSSRVAINDGIEPSSFSYVGFEFSDAQCAAAGVDPERLMRDLVAGEILPEMDFSTLGGSDRDEWGGVDDHDDMWRQSG